MYDETLPVVALIYDFDGTLSPGNMQEFSFIKALNMTSEEFWRRSNELTRNNDANGILCYMKLMLDEAQYRHISLKRESFQRSGARGGVLSGCCGVVFSGERLRSR